MKSATKPAKEKKTVEIRRSIVVAQLGTTGYRLERATNFLDIPVGRVLSRDAVEELIANKVSVTVQRNR